MRYWLKKVESKIFPSIRDLETAVAVNKQTCNEVQCLLQEFKKKIANPATIHRTQNFNDRLTI